MVITYPEIVQMRENGMSWRQIGDELARKTGLNSENMANTARHAYRRKGQSTLTPVWEKTVSDRRILKGSDGSITSEKSNTAPPPSDNEDELLEYHGYDPTAWRIKESTSSVRNDKWTSRIKVLPRVYSDISDEKLMKAVRDALESLPTPIAKTSYHTPNNSHRHAVLPLYDVHLGRQYSMNGTTLDHNDTYKTVMDNTFEFMSKIIVSHVEGIVIVVGQDFLNADNIDGTTTKGTKQDNSLPWHELFSLGLRLLCDVIDHCRGLVPVEVIYSEGNHDRVLSYCLAQALAQRYKDCEDVFVDAGVQSRKYFNTGNTLIGMSHNSEEVKLSTVMQTEESAQWGETEHHYWLTGHVHHLEMSDTDGVTIIRCPSPTFPDEWTMRKGFIGATRRQSAFLFGDNGMEEMWLFGN